MGSNSPPATFHFVRFQTLYTAMAKPVPCTKASTREVRIIDGHRYRGGKKDYHDLYHRLRRVLKGFRIKELKPVNYEECEGDE